MNQTDRFLEINFDMFVTESMTFSTDQS